MWNLENLKTKLIIFSRCEAVVLATSSINSQAARRQAAALVWPRPRAGKQSGSKIGISCVNASNPSKSRLKMKVKDKNSAENEK